MLSKMTVPDQYAGAGQSSKGGLVSLTDAELDAVNGGCAGAIILWGCLIVAAYYTHMAAQ